MQLEIEKHVHIRAALRAAAEADAIKPIDIESKARYDLTRNLSKAESATKTYDKTRDALIKKHGKLVTDEDDPDVGKIKVKAGSPEEADFLAAIQPILDSKEDVDYRLIPEKAILEAKGLPMGVSSVLMQYDLIKEG